MGSVACVWRCNTLTVACVWCGACTPQWTVTTDQPLISSFQRYVPRLGASESHSNDGGAYASDAADGDEGQQPQSILIPARDGSIIFYGTSGMQKLPHDARRLAEACPVVTDTMHFVGGKRSQLLGIDVRTGVIHRSYHSASGVRTPETVGACGVCVGGGAYEGAEARAGHRFLRCWLS